MHRLSLAFVLALAACASPLPAPGVFRDTAKPIYSNAVFEPARLAGDWVQVAEFAGPGAAVCQPGVTRFTPQENGVVGLSTQLCLNGQAVAFNGTAAITGPGRLALRGADPRGLGQEWWVVWADADYRTLAIGTPSGSFGFVLDRASLPADRRTAAREILEWNGYDLEKWRTLTPG